MTEVLSPALLRETDIGPAVLGQCGPRGFTEGPSLPRPPEAMGPFIPNLGLFLKLFSNWLLF